MVTAKEILHAQEYARTSMSGRARRVGALAAALTLLLPLSAGCTSVLDDDALAGSDRQSGVGGLITEEPSPLVTVSSVMVGDDGVIELEMSDRSSMRGTLEHVLLPVGDDCLAEKTRRELRTILRVGTPVTGDETGELSVDGELVAEKLARKGLAVLDPAGASTETAHQQIAAAQNEARESGAGVYSTATACTLPAHLAAFASTSTALAAEADGFVALAVLDDASSAQHTRLASDSDAARSDTAALLEGDTAALPLAAFTAAELEYMRMQFSASDATHEEAVARANERVVAEEARIEAERIEAERIETERIAAENARIEAERIAAEEAAAAERAAAQTAPQPFAGLEPAASGYNQSTEPWNQPGPDLDCSDIRQMVRITGPDYHRLDRDGDGWGCESYG
ncbi:MAG TPA: hypothetical protein VFC82_02270 [Actinomycetaceae bacterium]|nr:hypothetical protein [Actinomycetaceae bacterium]